MKRIKCSSIDKLPTDWEFWRKNINRDNYSNVIIPDTAIFCDSLVNNQSNKNNNNNEIQILKRIGSPSGDGEVYNIRIGNVEFAMKLIPRKDSYSENKNMKEIITANEASQYPDYFPRTFAFGFCDRSSFYQTPFYQTKSGFVDEAIKFHNYNLMVDQIKKMTENKNTCKRFDNDFRNNMTLIELSEKYNLVYENSKDIEVDFLISELANGDLGNFVRRDRTIEEWKIILLDVITGIYYLTVLLKKVHPDLHLGNILIIKKSNEKENKQPLKALIHDFGRCYDIDDNIPETYKASLLSFCQEFLSCSTRDDLLIPRIVLIVIMDIQKIVGKMVINLTNIKEIYEKILFPIITNM